MRVSTSTTRRRTATRGDEKPSRAARKGRPIYPGRGFDPEYARLRDLHEARKNEGKDWESMEPSTLSAPFSRTRVRNRVVRPEPLSPSTTRWPEDGMVRVAWSPSQIPSLICSLAGRSTRRT